MVSFFFEERSGACKFLTHHWFVWSREWEKKERIVVCQVGEKRKQKEWLAFLSIVLGKNKAKYERQNKATKVTFLTSYCNCNPGILEITNSQLSYSPKLTVFFFDKQNWLNKRVLPLPTSLTILPDFQSKHESVFIYHQITHPKYCH